MGEIDSFKDGVKALLSEKRNCKKGVKKGQLQIILCRCTQLPWLVEENQNYLNGTLNGIQCYGEWKLV
jgi:hypothetical protein